MPGFHVGKVVVGSDERTASTDAAVEHLRARGLEVALAGPLADADEAPTIAKLADLERGQP